MARWIPDSAEKVGPAESLGRRLFDQPALIGATDQKAALQSLDYRNFEEQRDGKVSLDRLGKGNPENAVVHYLVPRAEAEGGKRQPPKNFNGWATIQARKLLENKDLPLAVTPSPTPGPDLQENVYHSHAHPLGGHDPYSVALHLKFLFEKHGMIKPSSKGIKSSGWIRRKLLKIIDRLHNLADKFP